MGKKTTRAIAIRNCEMYLAWLSGKTPQEIAAQTSLQISVVYRILQEQEQLELDEIALERMVAHDQQMVQMKALLRETLSAWQQSKQDQVTTRIVKDQQGMTRAEKLILQRDGNPQFLDRAMQIIRQMTVMSGSPITEAEEANQRALLVSFQRHAMLETEDGLAMLTEFEDRIARRNRHARQLRRDSESREMGAGAPPLPTERRARKNSNRQDPPADGRDAAAAREERADLEILPGLVPGDEPRAERDPDQRD